MSTENSIERDIDFWSEMMTQAPWETWTQLRDECPVAHSPHHGGHYIVSRYDDIMDAVRQPELFSSAANGVGLPTQVVSPLYPLEVDPPEHAQYRAILMPFLKPRAVAGYESWIRPIAAEIVAALPENAEIDLAEQVSLPFPPRVAFTFLGFPAEEMPEIAGYISALTDHHDRDPRQGAALFDRLQRTIDERRAAPGARGDVVDAVIASTIDGAPVSDLVIKRVLTLLLIGGLGTTSAAIGGMFLWLSEHPADRARLASEPGLMASAIDEFVRWSSPVGHIGRTAMADAEIAGCPVPAESRVLLAYGSANRDPRQFDRPDEVDLDRGVSHHLGFGAGPHHCAGMHLGKLQMRIVLEEMLRRFPEFSLIDRDLVRWSPGEARGIVQLPIRLGAAQRG